MFRASHNGSIESRRKIAGTFRFKDVAEKDFLYVFFFVFVCFNVAVCPEAQSVIHHGMKSREESSCLLERVHVCR